MPLALGFPAELISQRVGRTASTSPWLSALWVLGAVLLWGETLGWADQQLLAFADTLPPYKSGRSARWREYRRIDRALLSGLAWRCHGFRHRDWAIVGELSEVRRKEVVNCVFL